MKTLFYVAWGFITAPFISAFSFYGIAFYALSVFFFDKVLFGNDPKSIYNLKQDKTSEHPRITQSASNISSAPNRIDKPRHRPSADESLTDHWLWYVVPISICVFLLIVAKQFSS